MTPTKHLRWDPAPILERIEGMTTRDAIRRLRVSTTTLTAWRQGKPLTDQQADRCAVNLGVHPLELWPDWHLAVLTPLDELHLEEGWRQAWLWREQQRGAA